MGKIKYFISFCVLFISTSFCFAKQISFQIVQHDSKIDTVTEQSLIIEDEMLNGFFEYGYIVTNSQAEISKSEKEDKKLFNKGLQEALEGFSDYFVQIRLYYDNSKKGDGFSVTLEKIEWEIIKASTGDLVFSNSLDELKKSITDEELRKVSSILINDIKKVLR